MKGDNDMKQPYGITLQTTQHSPTKYTSLLQEFTFSVLYHESAIGKSRSFVFNNALHALIQPSPGMLIEFVEPVSDPTRNFRFTEEQLT